MAKVYCFEGRTQDQMDDIVALFESIKDDDNVIINQNPTKVFEFNPKEDKVQFDK